MIYLRFIERFFTKVIFKRFKQSERNYKDRVAREIQNYKKIENVHELPDMFHYWSNKYVLPKYQQFGFNNAEDFYLMYINKVINEFADARTEELRFISIGAGNCDIETSLAKKLCESGNDRFQFECLEINPDMIKRGKKLAQQYQISDRMAFIQSDIIEWKPTTYHIVIANQSLHHFIDLEILFEKIANTLHPSGYFLTNDMVGRNGHQRWPEALVLIEEIWKELPTKYKYNHFSKTVEEKYINLDCSLESFEGIRAQDILPLLCKYFHFDLFVGFGNIIFPFIDRVFGHNYDINNEWDKNLIDRIHEMDEKKIESGELKPTQMIATMTMHPNSCIKTHKHLTPEFCVRTPD